MENRETVYITREETFASLCIKNHVVVFSNETYDKLSFEMDHISIASLPGMYQRTVTMNSLGKTFSLTGWKTGWAIAPPHLTWGIRQAQTYLTLRTSTPMQYAAVAALEAPGCYFKELRRDYSAKKEILVKGLDFGRSWVCSVSLEWDLLCGCGSHADWVSERCCLL